MSEAITIREFLKRHTHPDDVDGTPWTATLGDLRRWAEIYEPELGPIESKMAVQEQIVLERLLVENNVADARLRLDQELALRIAKGFGSLLADAPNFNEISMTNPTLHNEGGWVSLTVQRGTGKTPGRLNHELKLQLQKLQRLQQTTQWISIDQTMPKPGKFVAVSYVSKHGHRLVTLAHYFPSMTWEVEPWDHDHITEKWCDHDKENDTYYYPEGWYECGFEMDTYHHISATVTHWMPLPDPPEEGTL